MEQRLEERVDELVCIEWLQIVYPFAYTDIKKREFELLTNADDDPPLGCPIQLG